MKLGIQTFIGFKFKKCETLKMALLRGFSFGFYVR
nr:MAG TPA: hypothetical protein [Caudoviricetes sp.]